MLLLSRDDVLQDTRRAGAARVRLLRRWSPAAAPDDQVNMSLGIYTSDYCIREYESSGEFDSVCQKLKESYQRQQGERVNTSRRSHHFKD